MGRSNLHVLSGLVYRYIGPAGGREFAGWQFEAHGLLGRRALSMGESKGMDHDRGRVQHVCTSVQ